MAFMVRDGVRLYDEDTGGSGPVVLFLHVFNREIGAFLKSHRP